MPDHDATQRALGRLSERITDEKLKTAEHIESMRDDLSHQLQTIIGKLEDGHTERRQIIGELRDVQGRIEVLEAGQTNAAVGAAIYAGTVAKRAVQDNPPAPTPKQNALGFWERTKSKTLLWFAAIAAAGGAIASLDDIARFLERLWAAAKGGPS